MLRIALGVAMGLAATAAMAADTTDQVSVQNGLRISIIGGCHDCHTVGYSQTSGKIDPTAALKGSPVGYNGPWGTTYPANLRLLASTMSEDDWVTYLKTFQTRPPMPWYNVRQLSDNEMRSLYEYIKSLGEPGDPVPDYVPPDQKPRTPYILEAPPQQPKD
jgi:mono/diheme cytochrome c family protein